MKKAYCDACETEISVDCVNLIIIPVDAKELDLCSECHAKVTMTIYRKLDEIKSKQQEVKVPLTLEKFKELYKAQAEINWFDSQAVYWLDRTSTKAYDLYLSEFQSWKKQKDKSKWDWLVQFRL